MLGSGIAEACERIVARRSGFERDRWRTSGSGLKRADSVGGAAGAAGWLIGAMPSDATKLCSCRARSTRHGSMSRGAGSLVMSSSGLTGRLCAGAQISVVTIGDEMVPMRLLSETDDAECVVSIDGQRAYDGHGVWAECEDADEADTLFSRGRVAVGISPASSDPSS